MLKYICMTEIDEDIMENEEVMDWWESGLKQLFKLAPDANTDKAIDLNLSGEEEKINLCWYK